MKNLSLSFIFRHDFVPIFSNIPQDSTTKKGKAKHFLIKNLNKKLQRWHPSSHEDLVHFGEINTNKFPNFKFPLNFLHFHKLIFSRANKTQNFFLRYSEITRENGEKFPRKISFLLLCLIRLIKTEKSLTREREREYLTNDANSHGTTREIANKFNRNSLSGREKRINFINRFPVLKKKSLMFMCEAWRREKNIVKDVKKKVWNMQKREEKLDARECCCDMCEAHWKCFTLRLEMF